MQKRLLQKWILKFEEKPGLDRGLLLVSNSTLTSSSLCKSLGLGSIFGDTIVCLLLLDERLSNLCVGKNDHSRVSASEVLGAAFAVRKKYIDTYTYTYIHLAV